MSPNGGGTPSGALGEAIDRDFGSFENFKDEFSKAAATRFGSGWAWLCVTNGKLKCAAARTKTTPSCPVWVAEVTRFWAWTCGSTPTT